MNWLIPPFVLLLMIAAFASAAIGNFNERVADRMTGCPANMEERMSTVAGEPFYTCTLRREDLEGYIVTIGQGGEFNYPATAVMTDGVVRVTGSAPGYRILQIRFDDRVAAALCAKLPSGSESSIGCHT